MREGKREADRCGLKFLGDTTVEVEDLSPRLLVYTQWSAGDEGEEGRG